MPEAQRAEVPTKVGAWQLVRYVSGENAHFLYANGPRTFSLFVTDTKNNRPLKAQPGWKPVGVQANVSAFMHQDTRNPERTAIVFKHQTQRRMIMGKLSEAVLVRLAKLLR